MVDKPYRVELTASFLERLNATEPILWRRTPALHSMNFWPSCAPGSSRICGASRALAGATWPPQSAEALTQLAALPAGSPDALREYLHGDYLMLYVAMEAGATVYLLSSRHHRQLSFDFAKLWPGA